MATATTHSEHATPPQHSYLTEFIKDVPEGKRLRFISALKGAIRDAVFDGSPLRDHFILTYQARGKGGPETRTCQQRDFVVEHTAAFAEWYGRQLVSTVSRSPFPSRDQLAAGQVSIQDLAAKYRNRAVSSGKRKVRR